MDVATVPLPELSHAGWNIQVFLSLLVVATLVTIVTKVVRLPYAIALVIAGLVIGVTSLLPPAEMTPDLILVIMLPALLFEAAWNLHIKDLKISWLSIGVFATIGVVISMVVVAGVMVLFSPLTLTAALLFGAMISATDPISVLSLFRKLGIDRRLTMILEGESLFNDGTAVVLFKIVLVAALAGQQVAITSAAKDFVLVVGGGAVLGLTLGYLASRVTAFFDDHLLEVTFTILLAYGSYLLAEAIHVSPVIATICAGLVLGNYGRHIGMSHRTSQAVGLFWEYAAFVVNSIVFLLIGLQMKLSVLSAHWPIIAAGIGAILVGRAAVVYLLSPLVSTRDKPISAPWRHLLFWGALRGSLCMALALSLPASLQFREEIVVTTFGVVLFTLLIKGLTIEPLVKLLGIKSSSPTGKDDH
jgi:CPA1 family monovalent cation:H+ antiporter